MKDHDALIDRLTTENLRLTTENRKLFAELNQTKACMVEQEEGLQRDWSLERDVFVTQVAKLAKELAEREQMIKRLTAANPQ